MSAFKLPLTIEKGRAGIRINHGCGAEERTVIGITGNYLTPDQAAEIVEAVNSHGLLADAEAALIEIVEMAKSDAAESRLDWANRFGIIRCKSLPLLARIQAAREVKK